MALASLEELKTAVTTIQQSPPSIGVLALIVRRPRTNEREVLDAADLDCALGLVGDKWGTNTRRTEQGSQLTIMNARVIAAVAGDSAHWPLAGDQLYIDLDLSNNNLPPCTRLAIGPALLEVTDESHTACGKFAARFGLLAKRFVNAPEHKHLRLRGIKARVIEGGRIRIGDVVEKR